MLPKSLWTLGKVYHWPAELLWTKCFISKCNLLFSSNKSTPNSFWSYIYFRHVSAMTDTILTACLLLLCSQNSFYGTKFFWIFKLVIYIFFIISTGI
jgi:hypothetical protein